MTNGKLFTGGFIRLRVFWGAVCVASLVLWYLEQLQTLTWQQGAVLMAALLAVTSEEILLAPRFQKQTGLAMTITAFEVVLLAGAFFLVHSMGVAAK